MNTQLVDSLVQTILALPIAERTLLESKLTAALKSSECVWTDEAIETFMSLGNDAVPGQLHNTSTLHDQYLYGQPK